MSTILDDLDGETCVVCGKGFTPEEWEDRHWPEDGGEAHAHCCPDCNGVNLKPSWCPLPDLADDEGEDEEALSDIACIVCGKQFTAAEWDERRAPSTGGEAHASCSPDGVAVINWGER